MKKFLFAALILTLSVSVSTAQQYKKTLKNASKAIKKYNDDPVKNAAKLDEALGLVDEAFSSEEAKTSDKAWVTKGTIFTEIASVQINRFLLDPTAEITNPNAQIIALDAYMKVFDLEPGKGEKKDAFYGISELEGHLNNAGAIAYEKRDFKSAFKNFDKSIVASEFLQSMGKESRIADPVSFDNQLFSTAITGYYGEQHDGALPYLMRLYDAGTDEPVVYEALYKIKTTKEDPSAGKILEEGRMKFPDDTALLFSEINLFLSEGRLDELVSKLQQAIEAEPENVSVYITLGNVYDQLSTSNRADGNEDKANEYFDLAHNEFEKASKLDPSSFDAQYSLGALYYNKAASMTEKINEYANDFSAAGTKEYNKLKEVMDGLFDQALPYFQKSESLNPKDLNTLVALSEIHARKDELEKAKAYKTKYEALSGDQK